MSARRSQLIDYKLRLEKPESPQTPDDYPASPAVRNDSHSRSSTFMCKAIISFAKALT